MKKRCHCFLFGILIAGLMLAPELYASTASQSRVAQGRALLFNNGQPSLAGGVAATAWFAEALTLDASDAEAAAFLSVTRVLALMDDHASYTAGMPIENFRELFDTLGVSETGRDIFAWTAKLPEDANGDVILPPTLPSLSAVQAFVQSVVVPEIDAAISNLSVISTSFSLLITSEELGDAIGNSVEVDYGDVAVWESGLYGLKAFLELFLSYDLDVSDFQDIAAKLDNDVFDINVDLLDPNPDFLKLVTDGASTIQSARTALIGFIDAYLAASQFIRTETDDQSDDLFTLEADDLQDDLEFRTELEKIQSSLENNAAVAMGDPEPVNINFDAFFSDPVSIRDYLPVFSYDPLSGELLEPDFSRVADPTVSGIVPDGLPDTQSRSGSLVTANLWIRAVIHTEDTGDIDGVWQLGGQDTTARGDTVIWGYFYASPSDVSWGNENNPDLFVKIWIDVSGAVYVDYFHVSVPDIEVYTDYPYDGVPDEQGRATLSHRFVEHYYINSVSASKTQAENGASAAGYTATATPTGATLINNLKIGAMINTEDAGPIEGVWRLGGQDTTTRGDQVVWGYFYADPAIMSWGNHNNPDLFVKIWFDVGGNVFVDFFHVSVPDIEVYSGLPGAGGYDNSGTSILLNRFVEHVY